VVGAGKLATLAVGSEQAVTVRGQSLPATVARDAAAPTAASEPQLCVIVCTHERAGVLVECLHSLAAQTLAPQRFEVLVVDNRSSDATASVIGRFLESMPNLRAIGEGRLGLSHARNAGLEATRARYVAFLDDDARACSRWCESLLCAFETVTPPPVSVGGPVHAYFEKPPPSWFPPGMDDYQRGDRGHFVDRWSVFWGCNVAYLRSAVIEAGGFDPRLGLVGNRVATGEDTSLGWKIYEKRPYFWYEPGAAIDHLTQASRMNVRYRLRRSLAEGRAWARIQDARWLSMRTLHALARRVLGRPAPVPAEHVGPARQGSALQVLASASGAAEMAAADRGTTPSRPAMAARAFLAAARAAQLAGRLLAIRWW